VSAEPITAPWSPACMEPDELAAWEEMRDRSTAYHDRTARPCHDCLAGFAAEMRAIGRCNGTPAGFEEDPEMDAPATPPPPDRCRSPIAWRSTWPRRPARPARTSPSAGCGLPSKGSLTWRQQRRRSQPA
jgi:hypothetical protein